MKNQRFLSSFLIVTPLLVLVMSFCVFAQSGKISGKVTDAETGEPLPGANVTIVNTNYGAAASLDGDYYIINVPPGMYTVRAQFMGYKATLVQNVDVDVNRTTDVDFKLVPSVIEGQEVVIEASKVAQKKDQTSSIRNVGSETIDILPVESVGSVVNLQAGVVAGHFRGGRDNEVNYMIDGMQTTNSFNSSGQSVSVTADAVEEVEVIKGTFNAEYGRAMSGVVNAVTKSGSNAIHGRASAFLGNYLTNHTDIFIGLKASEITRRQDYKVQLGGPVVRDKLFFFTDYRHEDNKGEHNGIRYFLPDDRSFYNDPNEAAWYSERSGDSAYVPMNWGISHNFTGKLTWNATNDIKVQGLYVYNQSEGQGYSHGHKYRPDGRSTGQNQSQMVALTLNHMITQSLFYEAKLKYLHDDDQSYLYENPYDERYLHDRYNSNTGPGFYFGGQDKGHYTRTTQELQAKVDLTWQVHKNHSIKSGIDFIQADFNVKSQSILNWYELYDQANADRYRPWVLGDSSQSADIYHKKPIDLSAYLQDKMEFDEMVINFGARFDYFDPNTTYPTDRRNPVNLIQGVSQTTLAEADPKTQVSPRLGLSYQLGKAALLRFSYGHFFQRPPYNTFYQNNSLLVSPSNFGTQQGNPQVRAQKTVQYELGLWQELMRDMGVEVALFYRDIYDLLSMDIVYTYNQQIYGLYTNLDYGNAKGLEVTYDWAISRFYVNANYTLQYTRGNADNPTTTFSRLGGNQDPIPRLIPMSWDQRHTFNASVGYTTPVWSISATGRYNSGTPYTLSPLPESTLSGVLLYPNNAKKPSNYSVDLYGYYNLPMAGNLNLKFELYIYNLLDTLNEYGVYGRTGRAYTNIILDSERENHRSDFNTIEDNMQNPSMYGAPRMVKFGVGVSF
ncbi:TonB-dependent receptor [candidate division KSB1 bacterium]|nr:TonB-dependent receptor [candidate division KSB1 bacterium]RQW03766.1 MAG: TonB-dependent receptor [candidate division KSB1 bacterium]